METSRPYLSKPTAFVVCTLHGWEKNASAQPSQGVCYIITRVRWHFMVRSTVLLYATVIYICSRSEAPVSGIAIIRLVIQASDNGRSFSHGWRKNKPHLSLQVKKHRQPA